MISSQKNMLSTPNTDNYYKNLLEVLYIINENNDNVPNFSFDLDYIINKIIKIGSKSFCLNLFYQSSLWAQFDYSHYWTEFQKDVVLSENYRWADIGPYTYNRSQQGDSSYISIHQFKTILSQAPLPNEVSFFLENFVNRQVSYVIVLEDNPDKFDQYWSSEKGGVIIIGNVNIKTNSIKELSLPDSASVCLFGVTIEVIKDEIITQHQLKIIQFKNWGDRKATTVNNLSKFVDIIYPLVSNNVLFHMHCSAGIGRAGSVLVALCLKAFTGQENKPTVMELIFLLRHFRFGLVQTEDQYDMLIQYEKTLSI